jgi:hypothetical protein
MQNLKDTSENNREKLKDDLRAGCSANDLNGVECG